MIPGDQQERWVSDEVEQVVEPAMRIITGPAVQLGLDLQYPLLRHTDGVRKFVGVHRRKPPGIPVLRPLTCCPPSPCTRRTTTETPPHPTALSRQRACPPPGWLPGGRATADGSHVHHMIDR